MSESAVPTTIDAQADVAVLSTADQAAIRRHVAYHQKAAADHSKRGEAEAQQRHQTAADAHAALTDGRDDTPAEGTALRLSGMAEQATYQAKTSRRT